MTSSGSSSTFNVNSSVCCLCSKPLVKQWLNIENWKPVPPYDEKQSIITFGKHNGKSFSDLSKQTIRALLEGRQTGYIVYVKHPEIYCNLHRYAAMKWPEWFDKISLILVCKCRLCAKIWSCPVHGYIDSKKETKSDEAKEQVKKSIDTEEVSGLVRRTIQLS